MIIIIIEDCVELAKRGLEKIRRLGGESSTWPVFEAD